MMEHVDTPKLSGQWTKENFDEFKSLLPQKSLSQFSTFCERCAIQLLKTLEFLGQLSMQGCQEERKIDFNHTTSFTHLRRESQSGCKTCKLFFDDATADLCIEDEDSHYLKFCAENAFTFDESGDMGWHLTSFLKCEVLLEHLSDQQHKPTLWYKVHAVSGPRKAVTNSQHSQRRSTADAIRGWLSDCEASHLLCRSQGNGTLPTRLIEVSYNNGQGIRLVDCSNQKLAKGDTSWKYVALSHCWGKHKPASRTTITNLSCYIRSIQLSMLEQTFRDAITVTRDLGYKYLWIDTLCIVQDDTADWQRECSRMAEIYANASVTLAASFAEDAYAGFLPDERIINHGKRDLKIFNDQDYIGKFAYHKTPVIANPEEQDNRGPLAQRAWAFQEHMLSYRVVRFHDEHISLHCPSDSLVDLHLTPHASSEDLFPNCLPWLSQFGTCHEIAVRQPKSFTFYLAVGPYTKLQPTNGDDILPALSGISKRFHMWCGDKYFAGHWESNLVASLAWKRVSYSLSMAPAETVTLKAPSWSWASLNSHVEWPDGLLFAKSKLPVVQGGIATEVDSQYLVNREALKEGSSVSNNKDVNSRKDFCVDERGQKPPVLHARSATAAPEYVDDGVYYTEPGFLPGASRKRKAHGSPQVMNQISNMKKRKTLRDDKESSCPSQPKEAAEIPSKSAASDGPDDQNDAHDGMPDSSSNLLYEESNTFEELSKVISVHAPPIGIDPFGQVDGGELILEGRTQQFLVGNGDKDSGCFAVWPAFDQNAEDTHREHQYDTSVATETRRPNRFEQLAHLSGLQVRLDRRHDPAFDSNMRFLTAILLCRLQDQSGKESCYALVLEPLSDELRSKFKRVGLLTILDGESGSCWKWIMAGDAKTVTIV